MITKPKVFQYVGYGFAILALTLVAGDLSVQGQSRDPFAKPGWARTRDRATGTNTTGGAKQGEKAVENLGAPPIEQRIAYYKRLRDTAVANGTDLPKVTSVLTLSEMSVTGIFRTPRGLAAMVEATPIKLSYTIYPGEKFFDGQLVAVEENQLVFRRVTKMSNGKFVASVENKLLRQYTDSEQIQGTAPANTATAAAQPQPSVDGKASPISIVSPLAEMEAQPAEVPQRSTAKGNRKVRSAKNQK
ncbi:MAG TPA: hypothetical protein PKE66_02765 [Pyrinomonadaceae bacterium]|nr:hypothetical protein [Pyrinomonadaceae bacterium]